MKKIVSAGDRVYLKFFDLSFFHESAKEAGATFHPFRLFDDDGFKNEIIDADALMVIDRPVRRDHIAVMEKCRIIQALEVGFDFIDVEAATEKGIIVSNVPAYCTDEVANHTMTLLLALQKNLKALIKETSGGGWSYKAGEPVFSLSGKTLGIIGLGRIGRRLVPKAKAFGMGVLGYDPYLYDDIFEMTGVERCRELKDLLERSDYLSLHVPLTDETYHMIGMEELSLMKGEAYIINTCRGGVIDTNALLEALDGSLVAGAAVDVIEKEPPDRLDPILNHDKVLVTPHAAWFSSESLDRVRQQGMEEVIRVLEDKRPWYAVNPEVTYRRRT
ncbi:MAG TPA: C-terminal binding protein [Spirochaetia bacterium]|nr:C-terminal binding protein [Spirochaetia bacterium]